MIHHSTVALESRSTTSCNLECSYHIPILLVDRQIAPIGLVNFHLQTPAFVLLFSFHRPHRNPFLQTFSHKKILAPNRSRFLILTIFLFLQHEGAPCFKNTKLVHHVLSNTITAISLSVLRKKFYREEFPKFFRSR